MKQYLRACVCSALFLLFHCPVQEPIRVLRCAFPAQVYMAAGQSFELESKLRRLEQNAKTRFGGTTDSELSELEDVVARTAARVQSAESEVPISLKNLPSHFSHLSSSV